MSNSEETGDNSCGPPPPPQCQHFVIRKKRLCRMTVRPGRQYCGEHDPEVGEEVDQRIPCPNDPKHTCYISKLEKHLTKCNARKGEEPPYIEYNVNAPEDPQDCPRIPLKDIPEDTLVTVIEKINKIYDKYIKDTITSLDPQEKHHAAVEEDIAQEDRTDSSRRHLRQVSRIMQLTEAAGLVQDNTCYVEMGAGKGTLAYYCAQAWCGGGSRVLAVERAALRHKRDNRAAHALRLRVDLAHLALRHVPAACAADAVLALAKHLCGAATDYALRCVCGAGAAARGCVLATCCHHRCTPAAYVAAAHLQELGISREELNIIFSIVSWATCGDGRSREARRLGPAGAGAGAGPAGPARAAVGRRAKALVDYGRVLYLRGRGFRAALCHYVPTTESLENLAILAHRDLPAPP